MKKMFMIMVLVIAFVSGCGKNTSIETEVTHFTDAQLLGMKYPVVEEILGQKLSDEEIVYDSEGIHIGRWYLSYEYIEEYESTLE